MTFQVIMPVTHGDVDVRSDIWKFTESEVTDVARGNTSETKSPVRNRAPPPPAPSVPPPAGPPTVDPVEGNVTVVEVATHAPPMSAKPVLHTKLHVPAAHTAVALLTAGQTVEHAPQLDGSVEVFTQLAPQVVRPAPHVVVHTPALHTWPPGHAWPQEPQFALSTRTFVSHPVAGTWSQSAKPVLQAAMAHAPVEQTAVA